MCHNLYHPSKILCYLIWYCHEHNYKHYSHYHIIVRHYSVYQLVKVDILQCMSY